jgi:hypothetical protein
MAGKAWGRLSLFGTWVLVDGSLMAGAASAPLASVSPLPVSLRIGFAGKCLAENFLNFAVIG